MMAVRRRKRMTPLEDAIEHVKKAQDKTAELEVKYINSYKGRGVFAQSHFFKGDFVVEYRGELISSDEALRRRRIYHTKCAVFMFDFRWNEKTWSIDAAQEDGSLGRLVNDDHRNPNCRMKRIMEVAEPHLCLFALRDIQPGEEITYDYGGNDWPWRKRTEDLPQAAKSSEATFSRPAEIAKSSTVLQTEDQPKAAKSSKSKSSGPAETTPESPPSTIVQTEDQTKVSKSSKSKSSRPTETVPESPPSTIVQTEDQTKVSKSSKSKSPRPAPESPPSTIVQTEDQTKVSKSSKSKSSGPAETAPESPPSTIVQTEDQTKVSKSSKSKSPRPAPESPPSTIVQTEDQTKVSKSSKSKSSGPAETAPESPPSTIVQTEDQTKVSKSSKSKSSRPTEATPESPTSTIVQTEDQTKVSKSSKSKSSRPTEATPESPTSTIVQTPQIWSPSSSDRDLSPPDHSIPRLRRTESIQMRGRLGFESDELFDSTSDDSGEEHSKERRMHMEYLRKKGNFAHNVEVMNSGVGSLVPRQQPKDKAQAGNLLHCAYCQGLFTRKILWKHLKLCKFRPSIPLKPGRTRIQALHGFAVPSPSGVKEHLWKLLSNVVQDDVFHAVKSDACIVEYGEHLYNRLGYDLSKHEYIRQKLRELGRLLVCSRQTTNLRTIEDHIQPANFMHVVQAVKALARCGSEKHTFDCPSLALKIGYSLKKVSMLVESRANVQGDYSAAKDAQIFLSVYDARWNELISSSSLRTLQESKWNIPRLLPFTKDIQRLHSYLDVEQQDLSCKLSSDTSLQTYRQLAQVILAQVVMFNRRRAGEVSKIPLSAYTSPNVSDPQEDVNVGLSDLEKRLCQYFRRIEIRGKRGRKVPVLLTPAVQQALDLLISKREECDVLTENVYLFARPSSLTYYCGSDCLRYFAKVCGAKSPESLTSTKLRKQTATLSQVLNLSNTELDQLADFLGHDIRVHRHFYRLPEGTLQLAKISKILMALEQGRLAEFKGKSLDDINVDPEENVYFDSDQEGDPGDSCESASESDSLDHPVTTKETETDVNTSQVDTVTSTEATDSKHKRQTQLKRLKGRQPSQRQKWNEDEIAAVERHLMSFITSCRVPGKRDCDNCINMETTALKNRNWLAVKFYVKNRNTSLKRKV